MKTGKPQLATRMATLDDAGELCGILNEIIRVGGTTAHETELTAGEFSNHFLRGDDYLSCFVAVDEAGQLAGFQSLERNSKLPEDWADIATFARISPKVGGVGSALFAESEQFAQQAGVVAINATIRADNEGGLIYYDRMGFTTYDVNKGVQLADGSKVDRISKRFVIGA